MREGLGLVWGSFGHVGLVWVGMGLIYARCAAGLMALEGKPK